MSCAFRSEAVYDPRMRGGLRCPACGRTEWFRDGVTLVETGDGSFAVQRVEPSRRAADDWSCMACGYEAEQSSTTARLLARAVLGRIGRSDPYAGQSPSPTATSDEYGHWARPAEPRRT